MLKIHKASAGSGKTYTLAKEYLRLLLGYTADDGRQRLRPASAYGFGRHKAHGAILAVTFTNKATEEMIQRIVKELYNLSRQGQPGAPQSNYAAEFCRLFGTTAGQLAAAASRALAALLFNCSYFNVSPLAS
ncbi:MAG: UvrD-helicase domain-containing protein, partial [Muribaculaceae bacterium]|nr:UvrD-helicase domain-containing protein [Muribaculaceae bacterium]